jgi:hypothetical protein
MTERNRQQNSPLPTLLATPRRTALRRKSNQGKGDDNTTASPPRS